MPTTWISTSIFREVKKNLLLEFKIFSLHQWGMRFRKRFKHYLHVSFWACLKKTRELRSHVWSSLQPLELKLVLSLVIVDLFKNLKGHLETHSHIINGKRSWQLDTERNNLNYIIRLFFLINGKFNNFKLVVRENFWTTLKRIEIFSDSSNLLK